MKNLLSRLKIDAHPVVFPAGAVLAVSFVVLTSLFPGEAFMMLTSLLSEITHRFSWLYILSMTGFLVVSIYLLFSRYGDIRLGKDDSRPEFSRASWFAMLFSAGMGIGMLFYGVVEPMTHYLSPVEGQPGTLLSARNSMSITLLHWTLHPWALYALVALALGFFGFRKGLPLSFRSLFHPLLGERIHRWPGHLIDTLAVLATLFGLATSLGLGAKQVNAGLNFVFGWPAPTVTSQIVIISCITGLAVISLVSGLHVGIKWLSNINMTIAAFILIFLFVTGPTMYLIGALSENVGNYMLDLAHRSFWTATYAKTEKADWFSSWTVFYWGWWIAWSPFVGMFIARISKGRTIREFVTGVLAVPSLIGLIWFTVFGNSALYQQIWPQVNPSANLESILNHEYPVAKMHPKLALPIQKDSEYVIAPLGPGDKRVLIDPALSAKNKSGDLVLTTASGKPVIRKKGVLVSPKTGAPFVPPSEDLFKGTYASEVKKLDLGGFLSQPVLENNLRRRQDTTSTSMFVMFRAYPFSSMLVILGVLSIILFFVTSSDSASMVADIIASGGKPNPGVGTRIFWGVLEGALAASLLLAGGLKALQAGAISLGLPFCIAVIAIVWSLIKALREEMS